MFKQEKKKTGKTIGIWDRGKGTRVINSRFVNLDVGIKAEGQGLEAKGNKHFDFRSHQAENWYERWWIKYFLLPLVVLIIGTFFIFKLGWK